MKRAEGPHHLILWYRPLEDRPKEWRLSVGRARGLTIAAMITVAIVVVAILLYLFMVKQTIDLSRYKSENRQLRAEVARIQAISADLDELQSLSRQLQRSLTAGGETSPGFEMQEISIPEPVADPMANESWLQIRQTRVTDAEPGWLLKESMFAIAGANMPQRWPVDGFITRGYEPNVVDPSQSHTGVDIAVPRGTPVRASAAGVVIAADWTPRLGNRVIIDHGDGVLSVYGHNQILLVSKHDSVEPGTVLALSGNSGISTAPHLHFEIWIKGNTVDPLTILHQAVEKTSGTEQS